MSVWERYQFLRYYLPGSLFFTYAAIVLIPALQTPSSIDVAVGVFGGIIIASPVIGYLIYIPFNFLYDYYFSQRWDREALDFIKDAKFMNKDYQETYKNKIATYSKQKELIDLFLHLDYVSAREDTRIAKKPDANINPQILNTLQNQLNNFAARTVCGLFTPIASIAFTIVLVQFSRMNNVFFRPFYFQNIFLLIFSLVVIAVISILLIIGSTKVLDEAFVLENYIVRSRKREAKIVMERILQDDVKSVS